MALVFVDQKGLRHKAIRCLVSKLWVHLLYREIPWKGLMYVTCHTTWGNVATLRQSANIILEKVPIIIVAGDISRISPANRL